jgi:photosystem II stability/assembly factor-like uncharacterized protein
MRRLPSPFKAIMLFAVLCVIFSSLSFGKIDPKIFDGIKPRAIGPANMSGRIGSIDFVADDPNIIYVGAATGGVWKSMDGGLNWKPIFDDQPTSGIGAVRIFQANPNIVWVGTGEANPRNSVGVGRGVFKTLDGGKTWIPLGLEKTEKISRIILDKSDPDVAYVAALGTTWGENPERGVFKTTDGGKTWKKVLYVDAKTGAADLVVAPDNPNKLIVAMWEHRRWPWFFNSGGPGGGLFITADGGETWKKLSHKEGLPKGDLGRCGLAFATNKPNVAYALVEAKRNELLRSSDGGYTWKTVNDKDGVNGRPFYYADIRVNPQNENILYRLESRLSVSEDGGKSFRVLTQRGQAHSDFQAMRIHPDGEYMVVGNDGGIVISRDRGKSWRFARNLPLGQFYHVSFDMEEPYNVYGGLQDNGSWRGPAWSLLDRGIYNYHWRRVGGGDGFDTEPDPEKPWCGYAMSQGGNLYYFDTRTGYTRSLRPSESDVKHRYHWNAGLAIDPFEPAVIYYGSQFVHRSKDKGFSWEIISPDLTTNDPEKQKQAESGGLTLDVTNAENHTTILCIAPSPVKKGVIWVGTDDGHVQLTQDNGKNWSLVSGRLTGAKPVKGKKSKKTPVPYGTWAPHVEASKFDPAVAFVVFDDHRRSNWTSYAFMTEDYGKTWKSLATKNIDGFVHVIEQDHVDKNLLFLGAEFGLYFSVNRGKEWLKWTSGFPTVPVRDLAVHPRDNDLIIGTHGRSIYILDDISFLRGLEAGLSNKKAHLFKVADAVEYRGGRVGSYSTQGDTEFTGQNRPEGAVITFFYTPFKDKDKKKAEGGMPARRERMRRMMANRGGGGAPGRPGMKKGPKSKFRIEILDKDGKIVRELPNLSPKPGLNRVTWNFRGKALDLSGLMSGSMARRMRRFGARGGSHVLPGTYTVRLVYPGVEMKESFAVKADPRFKIDIEVWKKNNEWAAQMGDWIKAVSKANKEMQNTGKMIKTVTGLLHQQDLKPPLKKKLMKQSKELEKKLKGLANMLNPEPKKQGIADRSAGLRRRLFMVWRGANDQFLPINQATKVAFKKTKVKLEEFVKEYNKVFSTDVEAFKKAVKESGLKLFTEFKPLSLTPEKK